MADALFVRDGGRFVPTRLTEGPWAPEAQHGGPPAALLAGAIEKVESDDQMVLARVSVELLRPVPLLPLTVTTEMVRPGRKVQLVRATLAHGDQVVATAVGLKIRLADVDLPFHLGDSESLPGPDDARPAIFFPQPGAFAEEAMDVRVLEGDFSQAGPGRAWFRLKFPLVAGEVTSPLEHVVAAADFGNGLSNLLGDKRGWMFINPDLTVRLARPPEGDWFLLDSVTEIHPTGTGLARSRIADLRGWVGTAAQSLIVDRMEPGQ